MKTEVYSVVYQWETLVEDVDTYSTLEHAQRAMLRDLLKAIRRNCSDIRFNHVVNLLAGGSIPNYIYDNTDYGDEIRSMTIDKEYVALETKNSFYQWEIFKNEIETEGEVT